MSGTEFGLGDQMCHIPLRKTVTLSPKIIDFPLIFSIDVGSINSATLCGRDIGTWKSDDQNNFFLGTKSIFVPKKKIFLASDVQESISRLHKMMLQRNSFDKEIQSHALAW